ncbi:Fe-S cluster assembly protein dre2 [Hondaea fermentalgiana]|uniref:Anamorsin homolog n=1 Tax=Hondaea fermentalgiana TaxID=2315210 RepID=A0A2R5GBJ7_9STRA|nr:Fe-S cluster assembly protein dre2 [Hondaea fermentalgiana]|eukprot:GBG28360.1 Fe-S cluster assembly protein dre2 [Hondaea fermentalgiana]
MFGDDVKIVLVIGQSSSLSADAQKALEGKRVLAAPDAEIARDTLKDAQYFDAAVLTSDACVNGAAEAALTRLRPGANLMVDGATGDRLVSVKGSLLMCGFVDVAEAGEGLVRAGKPSFEAKGAPLKKPTDSKTDGSSSKAAVWKLMANDLGEDDELADEDSLLAGDEMPTKPNPAECGPDATTGKKRACKNCSCGLKEIQDAEEKGGAVAQPSASACGNCAKGDAFRCASCPYLGLPTFDSGTKPPIEVRGDGTKVLLNVGSDI